MTTKETLMAFAFACTVTVTPAFAAPTLLEVGGNLQEDDQAGTTYLSAADNDKVRIGEVSTTASGGTASPSVAIPTELDPGSAGNISFVFTSLNSVTAAETMTEEGGFVVDPDPGAGEFTATVAKGGTQVTTLTDKLLRVRKQPIYNQNEANLTLRGTDSGPHSDVYGYIDGGGNFVDLSTAALSAGTVTNLDTFVAAPTPANAKALLDGLTGGDKTALDGAGLWDVGAATATPDTGDLKVEGDLEVDGSSTLTGDVTSAGNVGSATSSTTGNASVGGVLTVDTIQDSAGGGIIRRDADGTIHIGTGSFVADDAVANHVLTTNSGTKLILGGDAPTSAAVETATVEVATSLNVVGATTTNGITNTGNIATGTLNTTGLATLNSARVTNNLRVDGNTDLNGNLDVDGFTNTDGINNVGTFTSSGHTDLNSSLDVQGTTNLRSSLTVAGHTDLNSSLDVQGAANLRNTLTVAGHTDLNSSLDVQGAANLQSTLTVAGLARLNGGINVDNGEFTVADGTGRVYSDDDVQARLDIHAGRDVYVGDDLSVTDNASIGGVLSLSDNGFGGVDDVARRINQNASNIARNKSDIQTNTRGIAMVAAMTNTTVLPGNTQAVDFNLSHFEGETGFGFGYARAINPNLQLKISVASTTDFDESVVRAGVSYQW